MLELPGYTNLVQIGEGGLGRVYRGVRVSTGGVVAIKELHDVEQGSPAWHRATREVDAMLRLKGHSNVVSVEEITQFEGRPFIVMEFLSGGSLLDLLQHRVLSVAETILVGHQVTAALLAAHRVGIIHRDIKPHNLLVNGFGQVKVADFGIAAMVREAGLNTQTQGLTPGYASPEEIDGENVGPAADVYSLGATLTHLVTGQRPRYLERSEVRLPFEDRPALTAVSAILRRCREHQPDQRPTMAELHAVFDAAQRSLGDERLHELDVHSSPAVSAKDANTVYRASPVQAGSPPPPPPPPPPPAPSAVTTQQQGSPGVGGPWVHHQQPEAPPAPSVPPPHRTVSMLVVVAAVLVAGSAVAAMAVLNANDGGSTGTAQTDSTFAGVTTASLPQPVESNVVPSIVVAEPPTVTEAAPVPVSVEPPVITVAVVQPAGRPAEPRGITVDSTGRLVFSDNHRLVAVLPDGTTTVLAGSSGIGALAGPEGVVIAGDGSIVFADNGSDRIMALSPNGELGVLAGTGSPGFSGDGGRAVDAMLNGPVGVALAPDGSILFADNRNHRVRRISTDGTISTVAGTGAAALGGDGPALASALNRPQGVAVDTDGTILIADTFNHRIRRLYADGTIVTIAGNGTRGSAGDGGPALAAQLNLPVGIALVTDGVAFAEYGADRVRVVRPSGVIATLAGTGSQGYSGDGGSAILAQLHEPQGLIELPDGRIVITDTGNNRLRVIQLDGTIVSLVA